MLSESHGQSFRIRESRREVLREVPHVSCENYLALAVQRFRDLHPVRYDGLPCFRKFGPRRLAEAAALCQLGGYHSYLCTDSARLPPALGAESSVARFALVPATDDAWCRVRGDALLSHGPREVLAPLPQHGFVDVWAPSVLVLGFHNKMDVRVGLIRVQRHRIAVADPELLSGECAGCGEHLLRWGRRRHRQHNFVDQLGFPRFSTLVTGTTVLTRGQLQVPSSQKRPLRICAGDSFTLVRLDLELSPPADVGEMRSDGAGIRATTVTLTITSGVLLVVRLICSIWAGLNRVVPGGPERPRLATSRNGGSPGGKRKGRLLIP